MLLSSPALESAVQQSPRLRALVVDDDPLFRTLLVGMLKQDYLVTAALDGKDGLHKALEHPPDMAIVDVQMPVWDGLRLLRSLRAHELLKQVPVVMLTSDASREMVIAAIQDGADDYVIKTNLSRAELLQKLNRVLERRQLATIAAEPPSAAAAPSFEQAAVADGRDTTAKRMQEMIDAWE